MAKWNASEYRKNSQNQYRWGIELIKKARIKKGDNVLDIGCGDGKITAVIQKAAGKGKVTGIDSSASMIRLAGQVFPAANNLNPRFIKKDAKSIDFKGIYDIAFSNACLHWIHGHDKVLKGVNKALKPGGRIFFQMGGRGNAGIMNKKMTELTKRGEWKEYFKGFKFPYFFPSPAEYKALLKRNGFKPVKVSIIPKIALHKGYEGLFMWLKTTWLPYTQRVPAAKRNKFIRAAALGFMEETGQMNKTAVKMVMKRLQVEAVKTLKK